MAGKGGKGLLAAKTTAAKSADKDKDKKKAPVSRSSRAGLQVLPPFAHLPFRICRCESCLFSPRAANILDFGFGARIFPKSSV